MRSYNARFKTAEGWKAFRKAAAAWNKCGTDHEICHIDLAVQENEDGNTLVLVKLIPATEKIGPRYVMEANMAERFMQGVEVGIHSMTSILTLKGN